MPETVTMGLAVREAWGNFISLLYQPLELPCSLRIIWCTQQHTPQESTCKTDCQELPGTFLDPAVWFWNNLGTSACHFPNILPCIFKLQNECIREHNKLQTIYTELKEPKFKCLQWGAFLNTMWKHTTWMITAIQASRVTQHHNPALFSKHREAIKGYIECCKEQLTHLQVKWFSFSWDRYLCKCGGDGSGGHLERGSLSTNIKPRYL